MILAAGITNMLEKHHFSCDTTAFGATGRNYDINILDPALPDISGFELLQHLRNVKINTPELTLPDAVISRTGSPGSTIAPMISCPNPSPPPNPSRGDFCAERRFRRQPQRRHGQGW